MYLYLYFILKDRSFGSNYTAQKYSTYDIFRTFRRPHSDSATGELCPLTPVVTPVITARSDTPQQNHGSQL